MSYKPSYDIDISPVAASVGDFCKSENILVPESKSN